MKGIYNFGHSNLSHEYTILYNGSYFKRLGGTPKIKTKNHEYTIV